MRMGNLFSQPAGGQTPGEPLRMHASVVQCLTACTDLPVKARCRVHTLSCDASKAMLSTQKTNLVIVNTLNDLVVRSTGASFFYMLLGIVAFGKTVVSRATFAKKARPEVDKQAHRHKAMIGHPVHVRVAEKFAQTSKSHKSKLNKV